MEWYSSDDRRSIQSQWFQVNAVIDVIMSSGYSLVASKNEHRVVDPFFLNLPAYDLSKQLATCLAVL